MVPTSFRAGICGGRKWCMMKYHKIRNVPLHVCTCEQKIAYNIAFSEYDRFKNEYFYAKENCVFESEIASFLAKARDYMIHYYQLSYPDSKYDIDAISSALYNGLRNYIEKPFIASSYEQIGKAFPALYI